ncbi:Sec-independent protein translocase protein TatB [Candidatus Thiosymbion oneisti]|uniref:Sec-independent protein translocase protein TatB n=1 Tax=Candidatus Thiosymbion oneisti TaxID=589554 RepID=UPI000B2E1EAF|nr:Sec-independent protein translocase protein TatB [Candidatus Thiosymbion oneisti]
MFDIGFWELALIGVILLLVVGPERLPKVARTAGLWIGRGRRMLSSMKEEIDREIKAQELQEILDKQARSNPLETILDDAGAKPAAKAPPTDSTSAPTGPGDKSESGPG